MPTLAAFASSQVPTCVMHFQVTATVPKHPLSVCKCELIELTGTYLINKDILSVMQIQIPYMAQSGLDDLFGQQQSDKPYSVTIR